MYQIVVEVLEHELPCVHFPAVIRISCSLFSNSISVSNPICVIELFKLTCSFWKLFKVIWMVLSFCSGDATDGFGATSCIVSSSWSVNVEVYLYIAYTCVICFYICISQFILNLQSKTYFLFIARKMLS